MGTSPDEDLTSYVHVAHGLEVSSQTNTDDPLLPERSTMLISLIILLVPFHGLFGI
jgi:hypothetical protein